MTRITHLFVKCPIPGGKDSGQNQFGVRRHEAHAPEEGKEVEPLHPGAGAPLAVADKVASDLFLAAGLAVALLQVPDGAGVAKLVRLVGRRIEASVRRALGRRHRCAVVRKSQCFRELFLNIFYYCR